MNRVGVKLGGAGFAVLMSVFGLAAAMTPGTAASAQDAAKTASIHGHVNNSVGAPIKGAQVRMTTDHSTDPKTVKWAYTFPVNDNGDYTGTGIAPNTYLVVVYVEEKSIDYFADQTFKAGEDKLLNFDMQRKEFLDKMTPEEKAALEAFKKKNAEVTAANAKIANLNNALKEAREDDKEGKYDDAAKLMTDATTAKPEEPLLWFELGNAQLGVADTAAKAAKAAGTPPTDPALLQKYGDAGASYKKAIDLYTTAKKPSPEALAAAYNQMGQAYAQSGDTAKASEAYDNAAKAEPARAGVYYLNEAIVLYKASKTDEAAVAADKAIAADPTKANAYYIKGQSLIQKVTVDPKTQKPVAPPGCMDAYQKYLELDPDGPHATEVKEILTGMGEQIKSTYKAKKK